MAVVAGFPRSRSSHHWNQTAAVRRSGFRLTSLSACCFDLKWLTQASIFHEGSYFGEALRGSWGPVSGGTVCRQISLAESENANTHHFQSSVLKFFKWGIQKSGSHKNRMLNFTLGECTVATTFKPVEKDTIWKKNSKIVKLNDFFPH